MAKSGTMTLQKLSRSLGVSVTTVSQVLNDRPIRCSDATRQRILSQAQKLNYRPNLVAKSLISRRTGTIGVLAQGFALDFEVLDKICREAGYSMAVRAAHGDVDKQAEILYEMRRMYIDGVMLLNPLPGCRVIDELQAEGYPMVVVGVDQGDYAQLDRFLIDTESAVELAVRHFVELGHRRIGAIFSGNPKGYSALRDQGWRQGLQAAHIVPDEQWYIPLDRDRGRSGVFEAGYAAAVEYLRRFEHQKNKSRPTAMYTSTDEVAVGFIAGLRGAGWDVPQDVSVVGMMALEVGRFCQVPVTSVDVQHKRVRVEGLEHLLSLIDDKYKGLRPVCRQLPAALVRRESTCADPFSVSEASASGMRDDCYVDELDLH